MNKKIIFIVIFMVLFFVIWTGNFFIDIKSGKYAEIVCLDINTTDDVFDKINAYRISPNGFKSILIRDDIYKSFYSIKNDYLKQIIIVIPENNIKEILSVDVRIKNKEFNYDAGSFLKQWKQETKNNYVSFYSPDNVRNSKSYLPKVKIAINWPGDYNVIIKTFLINLFFYIIIWFLILLFFKVVNKYSINNKTLEGLSNLEKINNLIQKNKDFKLVYSKIYFFLFFLIIFFASMQRFTINHIPYGGNDTWSYIGAAVLSIDKNEIVRYGIRNFLYPLFVLLNLSIFKDFTYIAVIQHLLGILTGILLLYTWKRISLYFSFSKINILFSDIIGLILLMLFLSSESVIVYEHSLRPEAVYQLFLIFQAYFLVEVIISIYEKSNRFYLFINLFFINNILLFMMQPRWGFALFFILSVFLILFIIINKSLISKLLFIFILPLILSLIFLYIPQYVLSSKDVATKTFLSSKLFFTHCKIIEIELKKDLADPAFIRYDREILKKTVEYFEIEYNKPQIKHKYLGFMHNNFIYGDNNASQYLLSKFNKDEYNKFARYYFFRAVLKHPDKYMIKVLLELSQFYNFYGGMYPSREFKNDSDAYYEENITNLNVKNYIYRSYQNIRYNIEKSYYDFTEIRFPGAKLLYFILSRTYLIVFILFLLIFFLNLFKSVKNRLFKKNIIYGIIIMILFLFNFFVNLSNAMIYCLDVARYIDDQYIILLLSQILAAIYIFDFLMNRKIKFNNKIL